MMCIEDCSQRERDYTLGHFQAVPANPRGARLVSQEAVNAIFHEPLLPAPDAGPRRAGLAHDLAGPDTVGAQKHDVRSPNVLLRGVTIPGDRFKPMAIWSYDLDGNPGAHAQDSARACGLDIPDKILKYDGRPFFYGELLSSVIDRCVGIPENEAKVPGFEYAGTSS
jgi:hypothetical protein